MGVRTSAALTPVPRIPLYERLVEHLRAYILEVDLTTGDRLPSERELAERLGVSRASVRQAIVVLEVQGVVEVRHGEGAFLRVDRDTLALNQLMERKRRLPDIVDAREALEVKLAELAARRRTADDLAAIDQALDEMQREIDAAATGEAADEALHQSIVRAARSELLARLYATLVPDIAMSRRESLGQVGRPGEALAEHRRIADAIRRGDAPAAGAHMREHLRSVRAVKLLVRSPPLD